MSVIKKVWDCKDLRELIVIYKKEFEIVDIKKIYIQMYSNHIKNDINYRRNEYNYSINCDYINDTFCKCLINTIYLDDKKITQLIDNDYELFCENIILLNL